MKRGERKRRRKAGLANAVNRRARRLNVARPAAPPPPTSVQPAVAPHHLPARPPAQVPADLFEEGESSDIAQQPSVMLVITILALAFIGLITWFVSQMPAK